MIVNLKKFSIIACVFILTGCADVDQQQVSNMNAKVSAIPTATPTPEPTAKLGYGTKVKIPLTVDDVQYGTVTVNQIEKVGINDVSNEKAVGNSVNYSFSVNITVRFKSAFDEITNFTCVPKIYNGKKLISSPASVGWTGFNTAVSIYGGTGAASIETGVQPEVRVGKKSRLVLTFKDSEGHDYDSVKLRDGILKKAKKGPRLLKSLERVKIKSVNGAVYSILPKKVYFENHIINSEALDKERKNFFDIDYKVEAWKAPVNRLTVRGISGGKGASMVCQAAIGLECVNSSKVLYQAYKKAVRLYREQSLQEVAYVTEGGRIRFGYSRKVTTNRKAEAAMSVAPDTVRLRVEYPDEAAARSLKQKLKFKGRFQVYQLRISERKLLKPW